jgi:YidC/Oxa1 family membrane protein insertase
MIPCHDDRPAVAADVYVRKMPLTSYFKSRRRGLLVLLLLFTLPLGVTTAGCNPFVHPPAVSENVEQAFRDGEAKKADALRAEKNGDKQDAIQRWGAVATYYGEAARKFANTANGIRAVEEEAAAMEKAGNKYGAQNALKSALRQYPASAFPTQRAQMEREYTDLVGRMDAENSQTVYYKIMDSLVRAFGNDPRISTVLAIFFIAVAVTLVVWPLRTKQYRSFKEMQRYQPELKKIQEKYKGEPQVLYQKQQEFFKEHGINQFAGCLPMLLQMPITLGMYQVILHYQYHFTQSHFLWINPAMGSVGATLPSPLTGTLAHNLSEPDLPLLIVYAISMFLQSKLMPTTPTTDPAVAEQQKMMAVTMPVMFFIMMLQWQPASAFVLYWFISNVLGLLQQWYIYRTMPSFPPLVLSGDGGPAGSGSPNGMGLISPAGGESVAKPMQANPKLVSPKNKRKK